jgi:hypothetical protein
MRRCSVRHVLGSIITTGRHLLQVASYVYFLLVAPVLRYGPNKRRFAYSSVKRGDDNKLLDTLLDEDIQFITRTQFLHAIVFTGVRSP